MVHPQTEARELYERVNGLLDSSRATLYEARLLHNQLLEKTVEQFTKAPLDKVGIEEIEEHEIFKPFQDHINDAFSHWSIANIWADEASWPLYK